MFCEKCGAQIQPGEMFCPNCGAMVTQPAEVPGNTGYVNMGAAAQGNTGYVNPGAPYGQQPYPQAPYGAQVPQPKKKSPLPFILGGVALVAVIAVVAVMMFSKPYEKPIATLFKAYNTNSLALLQEALSDDLYSHWNTAAVTDYVNDDSYKILSAEKLKGEDLSAAQYTYGVTQCYRVSIEETNYDSYNNEYNKYYDTIIVGKKDGKWKIYDIY